MDVVSPLSLLEVTMGEEINANDCIIIDDDDDEIAGRQGKASSVTQMEVEGDPLFVGPTVVYDDKPNDMPTLWVATNITNLANVPHAETAFRKSQYSNLYEVLTEILHCTICLEHVGCDVRTHPSSIEHPVLRVLICEQCVCLYKSINFMMNEKGKEINCRWCGKSFFSKGTVIRTCQQCPFSFCELCLKNNCPDYFEHEPRFPWTCIVCNTQVLWQARATLWALHSLKNLLLTEPGNSLAKINGDISLCCKNRKKKKKVVVDSLQTLGTGDSFDLDQLLPPHLLNGASEIDFYRTPQMNFSNIIGSYPTSMKKNNVVKSRAKPRPKSKAKPRPKPKSKTDAESTVNSPSVSVPATASPVLNHKPSIIAPSIDKKPHWLRQKLMGYINDFDQLKSKLEDIEKSLDFDEKDPQTEEKVDSVTTLLSLHRELLNSCRLSLINEWKERKARLILEKYNPNADEVPQTKKETPHTVVVPEKVQRTKVSRSNKRMESNSKVNFIAKFDKNMDHPIKECFVKLKRLEMPLDLFIMKEKNI